MKSIAIYILITFAITIKLFGQNKINQYEYWFDTDFNNRVVTSVTPVQNYQLNTVIQTTSLVNGLHTLHVRFKDENNKYSSTASSFFLKTTNTITSTPVMAAFEYWYDGNYATRITGILPASQTVNFNQVLSTTGLTIGLHTVHFRFKDDAGKWSSVVSQFFLKQANTPSTPTPELVEYEYWFDNNYSSHLNSPMSGNQYETVLTGLNASSLANGLHTLHIRFKDRSYKWSSVLSQFFIKNTTTTIANNSITAYRYWFDMNDGAMTTISIAPAQQQLNLNSAISMVQIPKGTHTIHFQFKDTLGMWSSVTNDTLFKNSLPIAQFSANDSTFCDNGTVNFDNLSIDAEKFVWDFGDGNTSTDSLATHTYNSPGLYTVSLTVTDSTLLIDSTLSVTQMIHIYETPSATINLSGNDSICAGSSVSLSTTPLCDYLWSDGSTNSNLIVNSAGTYSVIVYNSNDHSCFANSTPLTITLMPLPDANFSFSNIDHLVSFTNTSNEGDNYFWYFGDGNTSTDFSPNYDYGVNGIYNSYLVSYNFCGTDTAYGTIDLSMVGLGNQPENHTIKLYPNPASSYLWISSESINTKTISYTLTDAQGKIIMKNSFELSVTNENKLDLSPLNTGVYFLRLENSSGLIGIERIVVTR
jgi:PKD repeat protein